MIRGSIIFGLLSVVGCSPPPSADAALDKYSFIDVVDANLQKASSWPPLDDARANEIFEMLDLAQLGGKAAARAERRLTRLSIDEIHNALLLIAEKSKLDVERRRTAYLFLIDTIDNTSDRFIPRLVLRLKYEKDWLSNVYITKALCSKGNMAGLDVIFNILQTDDSSAVPNLRMAKNAAATLLEYLNSNEQDFQANWNNAQQLADEWRKQRHVNLHHSDKSQAYYDELCFWIERFRSQPLRPVDDARFVFTRLSRDAHMALVESTLDSNRYVRDHCLQTLSWLEGANSQQLSQLLDGNLLILENDYYSSVRAIEYRGTLMKNTQADMLWPFIYSGNYEQRTAAADSLLRCSDINAQRINELVVDQQFSPEARFSLALLGAELNGNDPALIDASELDSNEQTRRRRWQQQRLNQAQ
ncbi:MAG: hypothetical protein H8E25_09865 [Planctomycetes bacterium]|nr:hypothetical protein [Planctomycetota bacterium]